MKYLFLTLIILISTYIGMIYGATFKKRLEQLKELENSLLILQNEVIYVYTPLPEAIKNTSNRAKEPIRKLFYKVYKLLDNNEVDSVFYAFNKSYKEHKDNLSLKKDDIEIILDFAKSLGQTSVYGQDKIFNLTLERLKGQIKLKETECMKNDKLYKALGMCFGIIIVIFLL